MTQSAGNVGDQEAGGEPAPADDIDVEREGQTSPPLSRGSLTDYRAGDLALSLRRGVHDAVVESAGNYELIEEYWLNEPFALAAVLQNEDSGDYEYHLAEPGLGEHEKALYQFLSDRLDDFRHRVDADADDRESIFNEWARAEVREDATIDVADASLERVLYYSRRDNLHYERLDPMLRDPFLTTIAVNGAEQPVFVTHRDYGNMQTNLAFNQVELRDFSRKLAHVAGVDIAAASPVQAGTLPDGSHVEMALSEVSPGGGSLSIKKFQDVPLSPIDLIEYGTFTTEELAYLWLLIENGYSGLIAGGPGAGKTTTLNALSMFIPPRTRVVSAEETQEVRVPEDNRVATVTREGYTATANTVDMTDLLDIALDKRPDTLIVGELSGEEALSAFKALNTGRALYGTIQADSADGAIDQLSSPPMSVKPAHIGQLGFLVVLTVTGVDVEAAEGEDARVTKLGADAKARRAKEIVELTGLDDDDESVATQKVYEWDAERDHGQVADSGHTDELKALQYEPERAYKERFQVLQYLADQGISDYDDVSTVVRAYMTDQVGVIDQVRAGDLDWGVLEELA